MIKKPSKIIKTTGLISEVQNYKKENLGTTAGAAGATGTQHVDTS